MKKTYESKTVSRVKKVKVGQTFNSVAGCDVDSNNVVISVLKRDADFQETYVFAQDRKGVADAITYLLENNVELAIMESTGSYHIYYYEQFRKAGINCKVINPLLIKSLIHADGKNDANDAMNMAKLALNFELKTSNMPDNKMKQIRLHFRDADRTKVYRTSITNNLHATLRQHQINIFREVKINSISGLGILHGISEGLLPTQILMENWKGKPDKIDALMQLFPANERVPEYVQNFIRVKLSKLLELNNEIKQSEERIYDLCVELNLAPLVDLMTTAPSISHSLALRILGEMGIDFTLRYSNAEKFVKAIGIVPNNIVSGGKLLKRESSHGNIHLKMAVLTAVKTMCINRSKDNKIKNFYKSYRAKTGKNFMKAVSASARKLMENVYAMVRDNEPFNDEK